MPTRDLSQPLDDDVTVYPGDPSVERHPAATHEDDGYRVTELRFGSHAGTHVDAPSHTEPDGRTIDQFDVGQFAFDARLVDCSDTNAREPIRPADLPFGTEVSALDAEMLVVRTGWDEFWGTDRYYDHPYLSREAAAQCADLGLHVAFDALSPDPSPSQTDRTGRTESSVDAEPEGVPAHRELLGSERFVVENLRGLDDLPEEFELRAYPLALDRGDGSPVRAVAVW
ncbi:cyclase family protein [Halorussus litoreus]|uniref:cyclase family protein n=1 Tax=Halorussus litoreus TaxID=1710536 RepID=UPI000E2783BF|nr:cyclase family protein [Halorussus litoreus]